VQFDTVKYLIPVEVWLALDHKERGRFGFFSDWTYLLG